MTNEEWSYYEGMCKSYDRPSFKGEELFKGLFESDDNGIITFIKPPTTRYTSMEVFLFIVSIYTSQHMRQMYDQFQSLKNEVKLALQEVKNKNE